MTPVFMTSKVTDTGYGRCVGEDEKHLKASVKQNGSSPISAIGFNLGRCKDKITNSKPFDIVFSLDENEWNGNVSLQLKLRDIR